MDGLSLSRDNVTIRQDYETILRFYGYDLNLDTMVFNDKSTTTAVKPPIFSTTSSIQPSSTPTTIDMRMLEEISPTQSTSPMDREVDITTTIKPHFPAPHTAIPSTDAIATTSTEAITTTEIATSKEIPPDDTSSSKDPIDIKTTTEVKPTEIITTTTEFVTNKETTSFKDPIGIELQTTKKNMTTTLKDAIDTKTTAITDIEPQQIMTTTERATNKEMPSIESTSSKIDLQTTVPETSSTFSENISTTESAPNQPTNSIDSPSTETITAEYPNEVSNSMTTQVPMVQTTTTSNVMLPQPTDDIVDSEKDTSTVKSLMGNMMNISTFPLSSQNLQTTTNSPEIKITQTTPEDGNFSILPTIIVGPSIGETTSVADKIEYPISTTQIVFTKVNDKMELPTGQMDQEPRMDPENITENDQTLDQNFSTTIQPEIRMEPETITEIEGELNQMSLTTIQPESIMMSESIPATTIQRASTVPYQLTTEDGRTTTSQPSLLTTITDSPITVIRFTANPGDFMTQNSPITLAPIIAQSTTFRQSTNFVTDDFPEITSTTTRYDTTTYFPESTTNDMVTFRSFVSREPNNDQINRSSRTFYSNVSKFKNPFITKSIKAIASPYVPASTTAPVFNRVRITRKRINKRSVFHLPYTHFAQESEFEIDLTDYESPSASIDDAFAHSQPKNISFEPYQYSQITDEESEFPLPFHISKHETIQVPFKRFNTLLRLGYVPSLHASVLELPLDSDKYVILLLLPDQAFDLNGVMQRMATVVGPTIREIRSDMRQFWIRASVPKYFLKGNVVLTGDLMKVIKSAYNLSCTLIYFPSLSSELKVYSIQLMQTSRLSPMSSESMPSISSKWCR